MKLKTIIIILMVVLGASQVLGDASGTPVIKVTLLNQDPNPAMAGGTVLLRFKVENTGGAAVQNLNLQLIQDYPFTVVGGPSIKTIDNLNAYQTGNNYVTIEFTVKVASDALEGQKPLEIKYSYAAGAAASVTFNVSVQSQQFAQIIYIDKAQLDPGKETDMKFTITNTGNAPLQNLIFSWEEPTNAILPVYSSNTKYIKYLDASQSVDVTFKVIADVNAKPGLYQLKLNLETQSSSGTGTSTITTNAGVFIGGQTDFDVTFSESSAGQTSLSVANTGNNPAQSVSVSVPQQQNFRVSGSNSAIVGNLDKGDYTLVSFQIVSSGNFTGRRSNAGQAAGQTGGQATNQQGGFFNRTNSGGGPNVLQVVIEYTDTTGQRRSVTKNVPIQFRSAGTTGTTGANGRTTSSSSFIGSTTFWVIIIIVLVAGFYFYVKRIKKANLISQTTKRK